MTKALGTCVVCRNCLRQEGTSFSNCSRNMLLPTDDMNSVRPAQPVQLSLDLSAARTDWMGSVCTIIIFQAVLFIMRREGQVVDPGAYYLWVIPAMQLTVSWALGARRYEAQRSLIIFALRLLAMHYGRLFHHEQGLFRPQTWPGFMWELLLGSMGMPQLWASCCWQLPLSLHVAATVLPAVGYLLRIPSICGSPAVSGPCAAGAVTEKAGAAAATAAACATADGKFQDVAHLLDWPFTPFVHGRLEDRYPVTEMALCATVLAWSHIALAVVGSTAAVLALRRWQGRAAGRVEPVSGWRVESRSPLPLLATMTAWDAAMYVLCGLQCLWCMLRVACIKFFGVH